MFGRVTIMAVQVMIANVDVVLKIQASTTTTRCLSDNRRAHNRVQEAALSSSLARRVRLVSFVLVFVLSLSRARRVRVVSSSACTPSEKQPMLLSSVIYSSSLAL